MKVAYVMSRFPKVTETFVLYEIRALQKMGIEVGVYPLLRERQRVVHPEARELVAQARYLPFLSAAILRANWHYLTSVPRVYFSLLAEVLKGTWGSLNFLIGAIGVFPKAVRFAYEMERRGFDHLHAHFCSHPAVAALIVHRLTGIPFSFTAHGSDLHVERRMLKEKVAASKFAATVSKYNQELMIRECGEDFRSKIHVIHCGVDADVFTVPKRVRPRGPIEILCVASLEEVKGHAYLLEACRILAQRGVEFRLSLVGDGPLRGRLQEGIVQMGLDDRVSLLGALPRPEVLERLARADIFALASVRTKAGKREGIPTVLMEAMASGLPVVATDISGIPELVDSDVTGLLVESRNAPALASAVEELCRDPRRREEMGEAGRLTVVRDFNLEASVRGLAALFGNAERSSEDQAVLKPRRKGSQRVRMREVG